MKKIILITKNPKKLESYKKQFSLYGIEIESSEDLSLSMNRLKKEDGVFAIMWDKSNIYNRITNKISQKNVDMELVYNQTTLTYFTKEEETQLRSKKINGFVDLSKREINNQWWDDIFVISALGKTYRELSIFNMKNSGREELISQFIVDEVYYKNNIDLNFNPQYQGRSVEFDGKSIDLVNSNKYLNTPTNNVFNNIFNLALNNGAFFRSAKNRREKNYWIPGLNAGIPLVPKKDDIHEITFAVHDLCHFIMPDLIYTGADRGRDTYIIHRMMSEAITMVFADMVFIDGLKQDGVDYDFKKRKIYPLYEKIKHHDLRDVLWANVVYCLYGVDTEYLKLLGDENIEVLEEFKSKYTPFFVEDYKWTIKNYENMKSNKVVFRDWGKDLGFIMTNNNLLTITEFENRLFEQNNDFKDNKVYEIFNYVIDNIYFKTMRNEEKQSKQENISNSFKKYMIGQMHIFYKFDFVDLSKSYREKLRNCLCKDILDKEDILKMRALYQDYLDQLLNLGLINNDDYQTYNETYPIFDSFFVFYDKDKGYYEGLEGIFNREIVNKEWKDND